MEFSLSSPAGGELEIIRNVEDKALPYKLPASKTDMVNGNFGQMYFHHVACDDFAIWSSVYDIQHPTTLLGKADMPLLEIHGSLENHLHTSWDGIDQTIQRADQYNVSFTPHVNNRVQFSPGKRYRTLDFHPSVNWLQQYAAAYPVLEQFLNKVENKKACSLTSNDLIITRHMKDCLERITDYSCNPGVTNFFYEANVKLFIIMLLDQVTARHNQKAPPQKFTPSQEEATHAARDFLLADMAKPLTIAKLAQKVQLNECTLKKCFKHLFSTSIHQYYIHERMRMAKSLLLDASLPVDEIWIMLGYSDKQNFYTDFKKRIAKTPDQWCKENNVSRKDVKPVFKKSLV